MDAMGGPDCLGLGLEETRESKSTSDALAPKKDSGVFLAGRAALMEDRSKEAGAPAPPPPSSPPPPAVTSLSFWSPEREKGVWA